MNIAMNIKVTGEYNLVITKPNGTKIETGWFDNLILDQGLDRMGIQTAMYGPTMIENCQVGTGTTPPSSSQIALDNHLAGTSYSVWGNNPPPYIRTDNGAPTYSVTTTFEFHFAQGSVVGNITEVGVGWGSSGSTLFSRALILDGLGAPTVLTIISMDQLTVKYRITLYPPTDDVLGSVTISGTPYSYTARMARILQGINWCLPGTFIGISDAYAYPPGSTFGVSFIDPIGSPASGMTSSTTATYVQGSYNSDTTIVADTSKLNVSGGIYIIELFTGAYYVIVCKFLFDTPIPKTNSNTLTLTVRTAWSRA